MSVWGTLFRASWRRARFDIQPFGLGTTSWRGCIHGLGATLDQCWEMFVGGGAVGHLIHESGERVLGIVKFLFRAGHGCIISSSLWSTG